MVGVEVRDMTPDDEAFVGACARAASTETQTKCAARRVAWLRETAPQGVRAKVALLDGAPVGFAYVLPIELSPWGPRGRDLLVLPCLYVRPGAEHQGVGQALVEAADEEVERQGRKGLCVMTNNHEAWFMPQAYFEARGFETAARHGLEAVLWRRHVADAEPPELLDATYRFRPVRDKVVVDLFWNRFCLTSEIEAERVRAVVAEFGGRVVLNEHDASDAEESSCHQIPRAIYVQGARMDWGYEAPREGIRVALEQALAVL